MEKRVLEYAMVRNMICTKSYEQAHRTDCIEEKTPFFRSGSTKMVIRLFDPAERESYVSLFTRSGGFALRTERTQPERMIPKYHLQMEQELIEILPKEYVTLRERSITGYDEPFKF